MGNAKLKMPLFYDGMFNRDGRRMRATFVKEVANGTDTYYLWQRVGKPDLSYPRAENDAFILYAEINGYLAPLKMTEYQLINDCGWVPAMETLYGGEEQRHDYLDKVLKGSQPGDGAFEAAMAREAAEVNRHGTDPVRQADYIKAYSNHHVATYREAQKNGGETFPDFIGALILADLATCQTLSAVYKDKRRQKEATYRQKQREENIACVEKNNAEMERKASEAISILKDGGTLNNDHIKVYTLTADSYTVSEYSIFNYLMHRFEVSVPLRTQGWINESLVCAVIADGHCTNCRFYKSKRGKGSTIFFDCMSNLIATIKNTATV